MELRLYLQMLRRGWWMVVLTALAATTVALALSFMATPIYRASTTLVVSPNVEAYSAQDQAKIVSSLVALDKRSIVGTYAEVLNSARIYKDALAELGLSEEQAEQYTHVAVVLPDANILELSVEGPDPVLTAALANKIGRNAVRYISDLYSVYRINILDPASVPTKPVRPQPARDAALAFTLGVLLGALLVFVWEQLRTPLEELLARTKIDPASEVYNRRGFEDQLDRFVRNAPRTPASLALVRLEELATYMEVLPQPVVQQLLREVARIMKKELRGQDIVGRWDDITFAALLPETTDTAAEHAIRRVYRELQRPLMVGPEEDPLHLDPRIGIGVRYGGEPVTVLIERAAQALEEASHGGEGLVLFKPRALLGF